MSKRNARFDIAWIVPGALDTRSGGYLYDRRIVDNLTRAGYRIQVVSLPEVPWEDAVEPSEDLAKVVAVALSTIDADVVIEDELAHPFLRDFEHPCRVGLVHHLRSDEPEHADDRSIAVETEYLSGVSAYIYNSKHTRARVEALVPSAEDKPHCVATPGGELHGPRPAWEERQAQLDAGGSLRLLFVGTWTARKGLLTLLRACSELPAELDWYLDVVGNAAHFDEYAANCSAAFRELPSERVTQRGRLNGVALRAAYAAADLLVVPSTYEGFGIVYLEAFGFGVPAIAGDVGASAQLVRPNRTGLLVSPGDSKELADAILRLSDRALLRRLSHGSYAEYERWPTWSQSAKTVAGFVDRVR
ncbi:MAG: glycosyltransferase involved in cell wall biosynthesis [Bradymonadia bacterium]|jgi:glycosyltransferase involved in cell wall biosynthesis